MNFHRKQAIESALYPKRALLIYGPRRVGKTTMLQAYLKTQSHKKVLSVVGDDLRVQRTFAAQSLETLKSFAAPYDIIAIDEAQQVPHIGLCTKMIVDAYPEKTILLTGSSSFELSSQIGEPLTGRHFVMTLLPIAQEEMDVGPFEISGSLNDFLIYGSYPEILTAHNHQEREKILNELVSSYLYKDVLALDKIKSPELLQNIARMIAHQVGSEVSLNEIAVALQTSVRTVERYLDLLEKMFVIKKVRGYSRNLRNEITKKAKYYFLDNGVRNAVIGQFQPAENRNDMGALWENFIFMELLKKDTIADTHAQYYFWRTHTGAEIDIVREHQGKLLAMECKWSKSSKEPALWRKTYPDSDFKTISRDNYLDTLL